MHTLKNALRCKNVSFIEPGSLPELKHHQQEAQMPIINVKLVENVFDSNQKQALISKFTDAVESIYPGLRDLTSVTIEEIKEGDWGIGGKPITTKEVAAHAKKTLEG
jgi:4-oxalocrotonate tautomerase